MSSRGWNVSQLNDFFGEWAMHNVTWDYVDPAPESTAGGNQGGLFRKNYGLITDKSKTDRRIRTVTMDPLDTSYATNRRFVVPDGWAPQRWGYNIVRLYPGRRRHQRDRHLPRRRSERGQPRLPLGAGRHRRAGSPPRATARFRKAPTARSPSA